ncbi:MAG: BsuPI-related putative proteinase inhibitor [Bacillota bacterium]
MKKYILLLLLVIILIPVIFSFAGDYGKERVYGMEKPEYISLQLYKKETTHLVKLRDLGIIYGWEFSYDRQNRVITVYNEESSFEIKIGELDYGELKLEEAPFIKKGRTFISLELVHLMVEEMDFEEQPELLTGLSVEQKKVEPGDELKTEIIVYNIGPGQVNLKYKSGQLYDLFLRQGEEEIWHWAEGKMFTMALQSRDLESGAKLDYTEEIPFDSDLEEGQYTVTGEIATDIPLELPEIDIAVVGQ